MVDILYAEIIYQFSSFLIFEESPILYPLLMHDTSLRRTFQAFTKTFCDTENNVNLTSFISISKDSIQWWHDLVNGEIRLQVK